MADLTSFEKDIREQPDALRRLAASEPVSAQALGTLRGGGKRIILTGMGSSHFAGIPTWRRLIDTDRSVWHVDAGQLLDTPKLLGAGSTLIATSQSGASGEVIELLAQRAAGQIVVDQVIGIAEAEDSPL